METPTGTDTSEGSYTSRVPLTSEEPYAELLQDRFPQEAEAKVVADEGPPPQVTPFLSSTTSWKLRCRIDGLQFRLTFCPLPRVLNLDLVLGTDAATAERFDCDASGWLNPTQNHEISGVVEACTFSFVSVKSNLKTMQLSSIVSSRDSSLFCINRYTCPQLQSLAMWNCFGLGEGVNLEGMRLKSLGFMYQTISRRKLPPWNDTSGIQVPESSYDTLTQLHIRKLGTLRAIPLQHLSALTSITLVKCGLHELPTWIHPEAMKSLRRAEFDGNLLRALPDWIPLIRARGATVSYLKNPLRTKSDRTPYGRLFDMSAVAKYQQKCFCCSNEAERVAIILMASDPLVVSLCIFCSMSMDSIIKGSKCVVPTDRDGAVWMMPVPACERRLQELWNLFLGTASLVRAHSVSNSMGLSVSASTVVGSNI